MPPLERGLIVVTALVLARGQIRFFSRGFAIRNQAQEMRNAVEPRLLFIVGPDDVPGGIFKQRNPFDKSRREDCLVLECRAAVHQNSVASR